MYALLVQADITPEHREDFLVAIKGHASRCLANEPGTLRFDLVQDESDPNRVYFYEIYADRAAFEAHGKGESIAIFRAATTGWAATAITGRGAIFFPPEGA